MEGKTQFIIIEALKTPFFLELGVLQHILSTFFNARGHSGVLVACIFDTIKLNMLSTKAPVLFYHFSLL